MSVLEAWSHGLPVLMTKECYLEVGFKQGAAIQVSTNPNQLAKDIEHLFEMEAQERFSMGERGRDLVNQYFGWTKIAHDHAEVYRWMIGLENKRPSFVEDAVSSGF